MDRELPFTLRIAGIWLIYCAWSSVAGWTLSCLHALHGTGCAVAAAPLLLISVWWWKSTSPLAVMPTRSWHTMARRVWKFPPCFAWIIIGGLAFAGGALNPPSNYDALTYRIPRLLYWLQENHWYWVGALNFRMDIAGTGFEWLSLPFFAFGNGERALFLLNFIPFLLLPGLFFVAATGLGIRPRHARWWMWVWPLSFGIVLQAASVGNDMCGMVLAVASLAFTMKARKCCPVTCLFLSAVAAAAMTSIKVTMLPLGLPLAVAWIWVALERLGGFRAAGLSGISAILLIPCSFAPIAIQCVRNTGQWCGNPDNRLKIEVSHPLAGLVGNSLDLTLGTLAPPILPSSGKVKQTLVAIADSSKLIQWTRNHYPSYHPPQTNELPSEEGSGIGIGVTLLCLMWIGAARKPKKGSLYKPAKIGIWICAAALIAALVFLAKVGGNSSPRLMLPFTPFCIFAILLFSHPLNHPLLKSRLALLPALLIFPALSINPNRPLIQARWLTSLPGIPVDTKSRIEQVFEAYSKRGDILAPMTSKIPPGETVGFAGELDHSPMGLFRPFGSRRVLEVTPAAIGKFDWIVGTERGLEQRLLVSPADWANKNDFYILAEQSLISRASTGKETWILYHRAD